MSFVILPAVVVDTYNGRVVNENAFRHFAMRPAVVGTIVWEPFQNVPSMKRGSSPFQKNAAKMASISKGRKRLDLFSEKNSKHQFLVQTGFVVNFYSAHK